MHAHHGVSFQKQTKDEQVNRTALSMAKENRILT